MGRYRAISAESFEAAMAGIGFRRLTANRYQEIVYGRRVEVEGTTNPTRFAVAVFSSVDKRDGVSRECGGDAIRVEILDTERLGPDGRARIVKSLTRVHRTQNALDNLLARTLEARSYLLDRDHHCPACGSLMIERASLRGRFLGCTGFPVCRVTRPLRAEAVAQTARRQAA